jgi:hypothetical protein
MDDKMWKPRTINKEDENPNNVKEREGLPNIQENKTTLRLTT